MRSILPAVSCSLVLLANTPMKAGEINILWIGNSYTAALPLPELVKEFVNTTDPVTTVALSDCTPLWGQGLDAQYNNAQVMDNVKSGRYQYIVVQGYLNSLNPTFTTTMYDNTIRYGILIIDEIRKAGAIPVIFQHQVQKIPEDVRDERWDFVVRAYDKLADTTGTTIVAPCGLAWRTVLSQRPSWDLWATGDGVSGDTEHPGSMGNYINACVFYAVLTGNSPVGSPVKHTKQWNSSGYRDFSDADAALMQQAAFDVVDSVRNADGRTGVAPERVIRFTAGETGAAAASGAGYGLTLQGRVKSAQSCCAGARYLAAGRSVADGIGLFDRR